MNMKKMTEISRGALIGVAMSVATISGGAMAQEAPPAGGTAKDFSLPAITTFELENGIDVTLVPFGKVPKAVVRVVVQAGNADDGDTPWLADLTSDMLQQGAAGLSSSEVAQRAASMGGDMNIGVGWNQTFVTMDVLSENAGDAMGLMADVIRRPNLPEDQLARKRADIERNVDVSRASAQSQADEAFYAMIYPGHPYGRTLPEPGQVGTYTLDDVTAFHSRNYNGERTRIYVVGQFDEQEVRAAIAAGFGDWEAGTPASRPVSQRNAAAGLQIIDRPDAPQSTVRLGARVPSLDGSIELAAMDTLLGGYFSSRITRNIREDKGYTYSPRSFVANRLNAANWQQNADVTTADTGAALSEILIEIQRMQDEAPSADEVRGIKNYLNGIFVLQNASRAGLAGQLSFVDLHGLGTEYLESYVGKVEELSGQDFQAAARDHLGSDNLSLVVVGPVETVTEQISTLPDFASRLPG